jgi:hypothetical protein
MLVERDLVPRRRWSTSANAPRSTDRQVELDALCHTTSKWRELRLAIELKRHVDGRRVPLLPLIIRHDRARSARTSDGDLTTNLEEALLHEELT